MGKTPIEMMLDGIEWTAIDAPLDPRKLGLADDVPVATHRGELRIGNNAPIRCYQLSDGRRIMDADDVHAFFSTIV